MQVVHVRVLLYWWWWAAALFLLFHFPLFTLWSGDETDHIDGCSKYGCIYDLRSAGCMIYETASTRKMFKYQVYSSKQHLANISIFFY